jgi:hypothetical protein
MGTCRPSRKDISRPMGCEPRSPRAGPRKARDLEESGYISDYNFIPNEIDKLGPAAAG